MSQSGEPFAVISEPPLKPGLLKDCQGQPQAVVLPYHLYKSIRSLLSLEDNEADSGSGPLFKYRSGQYSGQGYLVDSEMHGQAFRLLAGAVLNPNPVPSARNRVNRTLLALQQARQLEPLDENRVRLRQDIEIASPTLAASLISGCSRSGPRSFRDNQGRLLLNYI